MRRMRVSAGSILTVFGRIVVPGADFGKKRRFSGFSVFLGKEVRGMMYEVRSTMYDVRCMMYGVRYPKGVNKMSDVSLS